GKTHAHSSWRSPTHAKRNQQPTAIALHWRNVSRNLGGMHAIEVSAPGGADALEYISPHIPAAGDGQIVVRTAGAGLNFIDTYIRSGVYPTQFPWRPGSEGAGEVAEVGDGVEKVKVGDKVAWAASVTGSYAEIGRAHV